MSRAYSSNRILAPVVSLFAIVFSTVSATPALPSSLMASQAVKVALSSQVVPVAYTASSAASTRAQGVKRAAAVTAPRNIGRSILLHATAYNSTPGQTDSTPFITATGTHVRPGVVALSRDLLGRFPYGTRISIEDLSGHYSGALRGRTFVVEDTMNVRISNTVDVWMESWNEAMSWGYRSVRITVLQ